MDQETSYLIPPPTFHSMREAHELANTSARKLAAQHPDAASISGVAIETFSELLNNAAEHGMTDDGTHRHVRLMPDRMGRCLDIVVADSGPGIRARMTRNPNLPTTESDAEAIALAVQGLNTGTGTLARGMRLKTTAAEMRRPGCKLQIHSGNGLLTMYGTAESEITETTFRQGTLVRATIPF